MTLELMTCCWTFVLPLLVWYLMLLVYFSLPLEFFCWFSYFSVPSLVFECRFIVLPPELYFAPRFLMIFFHGVGDTKIINFLEPNSCLLLILFYQTSCLFMHTTKFFIFYFFFIFKDYLQYLVELSPSLVILSWTLLAHKFILPSYSAYWVLNAGW